MKQKCSSPSSCKMKCGFKYFIFAVLLIIGPANRGLNAQILSDSTTLSLIKSGIDRIYNQQFDTAEVIYSEINRLYNEHPVTYLYHGIMVYWQNYPLLPSSPSRKIFEEDMRRCIHLCDKKPYSENHEAEALLANLCARGILLLFYADNNLSMNVITLATGTYKYIMRSFDFNTVYADLYYFTGLYNYYREEYPRVKPVYKAAAALFPPGDMVSGLKELNICARESIILRAEAHSILSWIYTYYEKDCSVAIGYSGSLCRNYPSNLYFKSLHLKNLLLLKEYDEAEKYLVLPAGESENKYYCAQVKVFSGIIHEKKYKNNNLAKQLYEDALKEFTGFTDYGNEFSALACFGLSRVCEASGDRAEGRKYRRRAMDLADFKDVNFD